MKPNEIKLRAGLKFKSIHFRGVLEIARINEASNTLDVIRIPADDNAWEEKGWNLQQTKIGFDKKEFQLCLDNPNDVTIW